MKINKSVITIDNELYQYNIEYSEAEQNLKGVLKKRVDDVFSIKKPKLSFSEKSTCRLYPLSTFNEGSCLDKELKLEMGKSPAHSPFVFPKVDARTPSLFEEHMRQIFSKTDFECFAGVISRAYREVLDDFEKNPKSVPDFFDFVESIIEKIKEVDTSDTIEISDTAMKSLNKKKVELNQKDLGMGIMISDDAVVHLLDIAKFLKVEQSINSYNRKTSTHRAEIHTNFMDTKGNQKIHKAETEISHDALKSRLNQSWKIMEAHQLYREWSISSIKAVLKAYKDESWEGKKEFKMKSKLSKIDEVNKQLINYFGSEFLIEEDPTKETEESKLKDPVKMKGIFANVLHPWFKSKLPSTEDETLDSGSLVLMEI